MKGGDLKGGFDSSDRVRPRHAILSLSLLLSALSLFVLSIPGAARAQSLTDALAQTYATNPTLRAARAQLRATNESVPQALSGFRPSVSANGSLGYGYTGTIEPGSQTSDRIPADAELSIIQSLYSGGESVAAVSRAEQEVQAQRASLMQVEQSVLLSAVTAFLDVWRDQSIVRLTQSNEAVLARQLEAARDRFDVGEVTLTDVAQSESRVARARAERIEAEGNLASSQAIYARIVGAEPGDLGRPDAVTGLPGDLVVLVETAVQEDPRVIQAIFLENAARKRVLEAEAAFLPEVQLRGSMRYQHEASISDSQSHAGQLLAEVVVPLYQQGLVSSQVRAARQTAGQARIQIDEARLQAQEDAIVAWEDLETARAQIESFESAVRSTEIALEGVKQENAVGARTVLDILDAEQEFLDAQVSLVAVTRDELVARYAVLASVGDLTAQDLNLPVEIYNPRDDYLAVRDKWYGTEAPGLE